MNKWIKPEEKLPFKNQLVFIKRKNSIYLGCRNGNDLQIDHNDYSKYPNWSGCPLDSINEDTSSEGIKFRYSFQDGTVLGWRDIPSPKEEKE